MGSGRRIAVWVLVLSGGAALATGCGSRSGMDGFSPQPLAAVPLEPLAAAPPEPEPNPFVEPLFADELERVGCVDITRSYSSTPATVMLLIDQSASMNERFGAGTRWSVLREAIVAPESGLLTWLDQNARVGLMLYTSQDGWQSGLSCPLLTSVEAVTGNVERVRSAYLAAQPAPGGDTPTAESIDQATQQLLRAAGSAPKYVLLLTDGVPDTCAEPDPQNGLPQALEAAQRAYAQGVRVYTVGVSEEIGGWRLQWMANAGAGKDPQSLVYGRDPEAEQPLFASNDPQQLADQLKGIIGDIRSCTVELGTPVGTERSLEGRLVLDGQPLEHGAANGWTFLDDDTLRINGRACEHILGTGQRLEVSFPCQADFAPPR
ncbi:MAG: hypothetical protein RL033_164 [Pseudomonadota bacterium]